MLYQWIKLFLFQRVFFGLLLSIFLMTGCGRPDLSDFDLEQGKQVYHNICLACHMIGMSGVAPKLGQTEEWAPRIEQGMETLFAHSINGFNNMPPKGGDSHLSEQEVKNAVAYMVSQSW